MSRKEVASWSRLASGTRTPSRVMRAFWTTRSAILSSRFSVVNPGVPASTTKPLTWPSATSLAQITVRSAKLALPIHFLRPSSTQPFPSRRAVVARPRAAPEPTSGSVSPKAPSCSMRAMAGSQRRFCSSEPQR